MSEVMKDIGSVKKDQKNQAQGFKFRGIDQFVNALHPALTRHGVFMTPFCTAYSQELKEVTRSSGKAGVDKHVAIQMCYTFYAEDGSSVTVGPIPAEGLDSGDKAVNKALSASLKYALIQTFSVPTEDMAEADLETPEIGTKSTGYAQTGSGFTTTVTLAGNTAVEAKNVAANVAEVTPTRKLSSFRKAKPTAAVSNLTESAASDDNGWA